MQIVAPNVSKDTEAIEKFSKLLYNETLTLEESNFVCG